MTQTNAVERDIYRGEGIDPQKIDPTNPFGLQLGAAIYQHKNRTLLAHGGMILNVPRPTPLAFSVFGIENLHLRQGDMVIVPRDCRNNILVSVEPSAKFEQLQIVRHTMLKTPLFGFVARVDGNRVYLKDDLFDENGIKGYWPLAGGGITKVIGSDRMFVDQKKSEEIARALKAYGSDWAKHVHDGAWLGQQIEAGAQP